MHSIRTKITILTVIVVIVTLGIATVIGVVAIKELRDRLINKHISEHAQVSINDLYRNINE